jgi:hypothetical protein
MDLPLVKKVLYSLMILTCHKRKFTVLSLQLNYLDNGWTTVDGMISIPMRRNSDKYKELDLLLLWVLQEVVETIFLHAMCVISMLSILNPTQLIA